MPSFASRSSEQPDDRALRLHRLGRPALVALIAPALALGGVTAAHAEPLTTGSTNSADGVLDFDTAPTPTIAGTGVPGTALIAHAGAWSPAPDSLSYQWFQDGRAIPGATKRFVYASLVGSRFTVRVTASRAGLPDVTRESAPITVVDGPRKPWASTPTPKLSGWVKVGSEVSLEVDAWTPQAEVLEIRWSRDGSTIPNATGLSYTPIEDDRGRRISATVLGLAPGSSPAIVVSQGEIVAAADSLPRTFPGIPTPEIAGAIRVGNQLSVKPGGWAPEPETITYRWVRNGGTLLSREAVYTAVAADEGQQIEVLVNASRAGYSAASTRSIKYTVAPAAADELDFSDTPTPVVSGTARVGAKLTALPGAWQPTPDAFDYQWSRNGVPIDDATDPEYSPVGADAGRQLAVRVTARKSGYHGAARESSAQTVAHVGAELSEFVATPAPAIVVTGGGAIRVGSELNASAGSWDPKADSLAYQWLRDGRAIDRATSAKYSPVAGDEGSELSVRVTASKGGYHAVTRTSARHGVAGVDDPELTDFTTAPSPTVSGTPKVEETLRANPGVWSPAPDAIAYQWLRDGTAIDGATSSAYTLVGDDDEKQLTVRVIASKAGHRTTARLSDPQTIGASDTTLQNFVTASSPTVAVDGGGQAEVGVAMTVQPGAWAPTPDAFEYQWERNGYPIPGAKSAVYEPVAADIGRHIAVWVTASRGGYRDAMRVSTGQEVRPASLAFETAPVPTISGLVKVGSTVTAAPGKWAPEPDDFDYQWLRDGDAIPGAKSSAYTPVADDVDTELTVRVTAHKSGYTSTSTTSVAQRVLLDFDAAPAPKLSIAGGTTKVGARITALAGGWSPAPDTLSYQWLRDGQPIPGATASGYTPVTADAGKRLAVRVTGTRERYRVTSQVSAAQTVAPAVLRFTAAPKPRISGSMRLGKKLSVKPGVWKPGAVKLKYQWLRNGKKITGATKSKYKLTRKDRGKRISVRVTASQKGYVTVTKTSTGKRLPYAR